MFILLMALIWFAIRSIKLRKTKQSTGKWVSASAGTPTASADLAPPPIKVKASAGTPTVRVDQLPA